MIRQILSRYHPRYIRALVYMMQASEYSVRDYLRWYHRVHDFSSVEYRKRLLLTPKATALLAAAWAVLLAVLAIVLAGVFGEGDVPHVVAVALVIALPFLLAYALAIVLAVLNLVQKPVEAVVVARAKRALKEHKGIRIAIAGSYGKTSMREILKSVLFEGKKVAAPPGSYNTPLGISKFVRGLAGDEEVLIFELGEYYPGDIQKLCDLVRPDMGIITGVNEAHLEKFGTLEKTAETIFELAEYLKGKPVYVNGENELARKNALPEHVLYNRGGAGNWKVENPRTDLTGTSFTLARESVKLDILSKLLGLHNIGSLAVAAEIASRLGLSLEQIRAGISQTKPFEHRLELRSKTDGVITLDDSYNGNPDGVRAVIDFLSALKGHRRFYVTPGLVEMGERKKEVHQEIGRELAKAGIEKVVLIRNSVTPYIENGLKESKYEGEIIWFDDALTAFSALPNLTVSGDVVLLQNDWPDQYG